MERERLQDWERLQTQPEGQFFERKSCYERGSGSPKRREAREVARDVAETLAAMANADGGTLALGIEDDGTPTGVDYPPDRLEVIVQAPKNHITPPVKASHRWATVGEIPVLVFEVDWSPEVHQLRDGRYVLRVADSNMPFSAADIAAMKEGKRRRVTELQFVHEASLSDINSELIDMLREKARVDLPDTDLGYMRELGEGVPRMFAVMEREGLHPPDLRMEADAIFTVILYNTPIFPPETLKWLRQFEPLGISPTQRRLLAYAHTQGGRFTSRDLQKLAGIGVYEASQQIKDLIRKGIVRLSQKRGRVYTVLAEPESTTAEKPPEYALLEPILAQKGYVTNKDIREALGISAVQARRVAVRLQFDGWLHAEGDKRGRRYLPKRELSTH